MAFLVRPQIVQIPQIVSRLYRLSLITQKRALKYREGIAKRHFICEICVICGKTIWALAQNHLTSSVL
jgi:hypothetical protein